MSCFMSWEGHHFPSWHVLDLEILEDLPRHDIVVSQWKNVVPNWSVTDFHRVRDIFQVWYGRVSIIENAWNTSGAAQGGGGSFENRKPIGQVGGCESRIAYTLWNLELSSNYLRYVFYDLPWAARTTTITNTTSHHSHTHIITLLTHTHIITLLTHTTSHHTHTHAHKLTHLSFNMSGYPVLYFFSRWRIDSLALASRWLKFFAGSGFSLTDGWNGGLARCTLDMSEARVPNFLRYLR
jgi:hypothetical protein